MSHFLTMFLAPEGCAPQATLTSPPADERPARRRIPGPWSLRFMAVVVANAAGFGLLLAGCWFSLQLMQAFLVP
jgi:hypothetical protein